MQTTMANQIGSIPEFTEDESPNASELGSEVSLSSNEQATTEVVEEKEIPSEPPAESTPAEVQEEPGEDIGGLKTEIENVRKEIEGLKTDRKELLLELGELRGARREAKQAEIDQLQEKIDTLEDVNPQDVQTIERIMKAKGYVSKEQVSQMLYNAERANQINNFLSEFREYSDVNDPDKKRFNLLINDVTEHYKEPRDPKMYGELLRRAHRDLTGTQSSSGRDTQIKQRQINIARVGSGGTQRSSSAKTFSQFKRDQLLAGGWSEEDIKGMEQRQ